MCCGMISQVSPMCAISAIYRSLSAIFRKVKLALKPSKESHLFALWFAGPEQVLSDKKDTEILSFPIKYSTNLKWLKPASATEMSHAVSRRLLGLYVFIFTFPIYSNRLHAHYETDIVAFIPCWYYSTQLWSNGTASKSATQKHCSSEFGILNQQLRNPSFWNQW